jgi:hypothetical protein
MSSPVQIACPERAPFLTEQRLVGGHERNRAVPPVHREPEHQRGFEVEGKIKGRGTPAREKSVCTWGWRGTRQEPTSCREDTQPRIGVGEFACFLRWTLTALDATTP